MNVPQPLLKYGLAQLASDALRKIGTPASRVGQTVGDAHDSAGSHEPDGRINGHPYSAATDLHVNDLTEAELRLLLARLAGVGFAAFARRPGHDGWPDGKALHVHCVFANVPMKGQLRNQVHSWCHSPMLDGLKRSEAYLFWQPDHEMVEIVRGLFLAHNRAVG